MKWHITNSQLYLIIVILGVILLMILNSFSCQNSYSFKAWCLTWWWNKLLSTFCPFTEIENCIYRIYDKKSRSGRKNCCSFRILSFKCPQLLLCKALAVQNLAISEMRPIRGKVKKLESKNVSSLIWFSADKLTR